MLKRPAVRASLALLSLAALAAVFFSDGLFGDSRTLIWDSADNSLAYMNLVSRLWRSGQVPRWNPFLYNGYPMLAEPLYQIFYPPNVLLSLVSAFSPRAILFQLALHQVLGGFFTYLLAGLWMRSTRARLLAGIVYMLNGCFWARQEHVATLDTEISVAARALHRRAGLARANGAAHGARRGVDRAPRPRGPSAELLLQPARRRAHDAVLDRRGPRRARGPGVAAARESSSPRSRSACSSAPRSSSPRSSSSASRTASAGSPTGSRSPPARCGPRTS